MKARVWAGAALLRALGATWRIETNGLDALDAARAASPGGNIIYAFWHRSLVMLAYTHRHRNVRVLTSQHRDGEWIAGILQHLGYTTVRGSSRRGGVEALFRLATELEAGHDVAIAVDGPIGPRYSVQPGVAILARRTGRPIVPIIPVESRGLHLGTWDALRLPAPGARVTVAYAAAIWVPERAAASSLAATGDRLGAALREATEREDSRYGRRVEWSDIQDRRSLWERASESPQPLVVLRAAARVYGLGVGVERRLRPRPRGRGGRPWVIGIGNLEAGGTGKTPCLAVLAAAYADAGHAVAVLTRGHGGDLGRRPQFVDDTTLARASDETRWLVAALGARVPVLVARDKAAGLAHLRQRGSADLVLVDDAFQTAGLAVDRHLVLLDWAEPLGNGWLLPAGRLREPVTALARAAALLFTRAHASRPPSIMAMRSEVPRFVAFEAGSALRTLPGSAFDGERLRGHGVALLCGLGRPRSFERTAADFAVRHGFSIRRSVRVGDHAPLAGELRRLARKLDRLGCDRIVISAKDAARLPLGQQWDEPLLVLEQRLVIPDLVSLLDRLAPQSCSSSPKLANTTDTDA